MGYSCARTRRISQLFWLGILVLFIARCGVEYRAESFELPTDIPFEEAAEKNPGVRDALINGIPLLPNYGWHKATYYAGGSVWTWTFGGGTFSTTIKKYHHSTSNLGTFSGTYVGYTTNFYLFTVTAASGSIGPSINDSIWGYVVPGSLLITHLNTEDPTDAKLAPTARTCPPSSANVNFVYGIAGSGFSNLDTPRFWGEIIIPAGAQSALTGTGFRLDGTVTTGLTYNNLYGCVDGLITLDDGGFLTYAPKGMGIIHTEDFGSLISLPDDGQVNEHSLKGRNFWGVEASSAGTSPIKVEFDGNGLGTITPVAAANGSATGGSTQVLNFSTAGSGNKAGFLKLMNTSGTDVYTYWGAMHLNLDGTGKSFLAATGIHSGNTQAKTLILTERFGTTGELVTTFNTDGKFFYHNDHEGNADLKLLSEGKILAMGVYRVSGDDGFGLYRLDQYGNLDTSFHTDGIAILTFAGRDVEMGGVAIQTNGKAVVAGMFLDGGYEIVFARFNTNGELDTDFGTNGSFQIDAGGLGESGDPKIDASGKIIYGAKADDGVDKYAVLLRLTSDGDLDPTFHTNGLFKFNATANENTVSGITFLTDGKMLLSISGAGFGEGGSAMLFRLGTDGNIDSSFGTNGSFSFEFGDMYDAFGEVTPLPDGRMLALAFTVAMDMSVDAGLMMINSDGTVDTDWGTDGVAFHDLGSSLLPLGGTIFTDGTALFAGFESPNWFNFNDGNGVVLKIKTDGSLDTTFGTNGSLTFDLSQTGGHNSIFGAVYATDGKVIVSGYSENAVTGASGRDMFILKIWP